MRGTLPVLLYLCAAISSYAPYIASAKGEDLTVSSTEKGKLIDYVENASILNSFDISNEVRLHVTLSSNIGYESETKYIAYIYNLYNKIAGFSDKESGQTINISIGNGIIDAVKNGDLKTQFTEEAKRTISPGDYCYGESSINKINNVYITAIIVYDPSIGGTINKCIRSNLATLFGFKISIADYINAENSESVKFDTLQLRAINIRNACYKLIGKRKAFNDCVESEAE